jgi:hypothetical protein
MLINHYKSKLMRIAYQLCFFLGLSSAIIAVDVLPRYEQGHFTLGNEVLAKPPSDADLQKYATAANQIEDLRKKTYRNIRGMVDESKSPQLACHQQESFSQLPSDARSMATGYCKKSEEIVKNSGLTINQFNYITQELKQNPDLYQRLQEIMKR